jgi:hypothetical protein
VETLDLKVNSRLVIKVVGSPLQKCRRLLVVTLTDYARPVE